MTTTLGTLSSMHFVKGNSVTWVNKVTVTMSLAYKSLLKTLTKFSVLSLQPRHDNDDESPLDANPNTLDDFNVNENAKSMDDWFGVQPTPELTQKSTSKISEAVAIEVSLVCHVLL
jgi:hypothetical protein